MSPHNYFLLNFAENFRLLIHPNLIKYHEVFTDEDNFYIILDYPDGFNTTLEEETKNSNSLSEKQIRKIMLQILYGIFYLHNLDIIHRELSLENILVNLNSKSNVNIKLFNLDQAVEEKMNIKKEVNVYEKLNSVHYMSPEALIKEHSKKSDVWSSGVILYYLIYGYFPFDGQNVDEIYTQIKQGTVLLKNHNKYNQYISPKVIDLISKMLVFSPDERYNIYECLNHPWFDNENEIEEKNGLGALIRCAISILLRNIYHKHNFTDLHQLYNELIEKKRLLFISDIYGYLGVPNRKFTHKRNLQNKELTFSDFCDYLMSSDLLLSNSNLSFLFDYLDKDTDNMLSMDDFRKIFISVYSGTEEEDDIEFLLMSLEHKTIVFPEFKQLLFNYHKYLGYL